MSEQRWNDFICSKCGALAHCRTDMYLQGGVPAPGLEYLCKACLETTELPPNTAILVTRCAEPNCGRMANGRFELSSSLPDEGEIPEVHYLCAEHAWRWRQSLGSEWEMTCQSLSPNGQEHFDQPRTFARDDLRGAVWGEASDRVN
jgi:hypothetical protein